MADCSALDRGSIGLNIEYRLHHDGDGSGCGRSDLAIVHPAGQESAAKEFGKDLSLGMLIALKSGLAFGWPMVS